MRRARLILGTWPISCDVADGAREQAIGLAGRRAPLTDSEGLYMPVQPPGGLASVVAGGILWPIDVLFFQDHELARVVPNLQPGDRRRWTFAPSTGVLELRSGWAQAHRLRLGTQLLFTVYL